nr:PREDICTED: hepatocyte cell adhesion molecule-like isoform X2 [Lepisosteus oculatus]
MDLEGLRQAWGGRLSRLQQRDCPELACLLLLLPLLLSWIGKTAWTLPLQERFYAELHTTAALTAVRLHAQNDPVASVTWKKISMTGSNPVNILMHNSQSDPIIFGQYKTRIQHYLDNSTLVLKDVTEEDEGLYEVTWELQNSNLIRINTSLSIIPPLSEPRISISSPSSQAGLTLTCQVTGGSGASYWWLRDGRPLPQDGRHSVSDRNTSLQIGNLTAADCVSYSCVAANILRSREVHIQLTGENFTFCSQTLGLALQPRFILSIAAGSFCLLGLCVIVFCVRKFHQEMLHWFRDLWNKDSIKLSRGEEHVYNEVIDEQGAADPKLQAQYVYLGFMPLSERQCSRPLGQELDDLGYSTIGPAPGAGPSLDSNSATWPAQRRLQ